AQPDEPREGERPRPPWVEPPPGCEADQREGPEHDQCCVDDDRPGPGERGGPYEASVQPEGEQAEHDRGDESHRTILPIGRLATCPTYSSPRSTWPNSFSGPRRWFSTCAGGSAISTDARTTARRTSRA